MEEVQEQVSELASQPALIVATAEDTQEAVLAELDRRIRALEAAIGDVQHVKASAAIGRKTAGAMMTKSVDTMDAEEAFRSLSVEQRIVVKSGLIRAGLL